MDTEKLTAIDFGISIEPVKIKFGETIVNNFSISPIVQETGQRSLKRTDRKVILFMKAMQTKNEFQDMNYAGKCLIEKLEKDNK